MGIKWASSGMASPLLHKLFDVARNVEVGEGSQCSLRPKFFYPRHLTGLEVVLVP